MTSFAWERDEATIGTVDESQRMAARVVGIIYLLALVTANFSIFYVRSRLIVSGNAAETARNIMANERLFRLGIASDLVTFAADVILVVALFVVLRSVDRNLALLAAAWRLVETAVFVVITFSSFDVLRLLSGAGYLRVLEADRLQALASLNVGAYSDGYKVGLVFFGLGSTVFSYLWFKSRYVPRGLAALGMFSSLLVATCALALLVVPEFANIAVPAYIVPIFLFELTMGIWLLARGLRQSAVRQPLKSVGSPTTPQPQRGSPGQ